MNSNDQPNMRGHSVVEKFLDFAAKLVYISRQISSDDKS